MSYIIETSQPLICGHQYHIFNRGNQGQNIFFKDDNYLYFLEKYAHYMNQYWTTYSYALLPNHFHLTIEVKSKAEIIEAATIDFPKVHQNFLSKFYPFAEFQASPDLLSFKNLVSLTPEQYSSSFQRSSLEEFKSKLLQWAVSERFRRFLMSYAKAINKQEKLFGSLFQKVFRRKLIEEEAYLTYLIIYHHRNPIHHGRALMLKDWVWTSYQGILSKKDTKLERAKVLDLFGGKIAFQEKHEAHILNWKNQEKWYLE